MKFKSAALSAVLCSAIASSALAAPKGHILELVDYHGDEVTASAKQSWLGLYKDSGGKFTLKPTKISITKVNDPIIDEDPKGRSGKRISVATKEKPIYVISGVAGLKPGPVVAGTPLTSDHLDIGRKIKLKVRSSEATLVVTGRKKNADFRTHYKITLESGGIKQQLMRGEEIGVDTAPSLLWCGDLDGDGKLDLIMDTTDNYNVSNVVLFLSSKAQPGKIVRDVAVQLATGC